MKRAFLKMILGKNHKSNRKYKAFCLKILVIPSYPEQLSEIYLIYRMSLQSINRHKD